MMFSTKAEYGIRIMPHLAPYDGDGPVSLSVIADAERLPLAYLKHLSQRLRRAALPDSARGEVADGDGAASAEDGTDAAPDERANAGATPASQDPATRPGGSVANCLRTAVNARRE